MTPSGMDAKMAREIVSAFKKFRDASKPWPQTPEPYPFNSEHEAKGYLAGMKDPAVLALVEALELYEKEVLDVFSKWVPNPAMKALAQYREATQ